MAIKHKKPRTKATITDKVSLFFPFNLVQPSFNTNGRRST
jgi:hypothetical protein